jgi:hypothetical protein
MQGMMGNGQLPIIVLNMTTKRETGRTAQLSNIKAAKVNLPILTPPPRLLQMSSEQP